MRILGSLVLDIVLVAVFAVIGRASHAESLDLAGIATTAWPFAVSVALGSVVASLAQNWPWWAAGHLRLGGRPRRRHGAAGGLRRLHGSRASSSSAASASPSS